MENNCLEAQYECYITFKTPFNLTQVEDYWVKWAKLYVVPKEGDEPIEYEPVMEFEPDYKYSSSETILDEKDAGL